MPPLSEQTERILDGKVRLTKRRNSRYWQAHFKVGNRKIRETTRHADLCEARKIATDAYMNALYRSKNNLPPQSKPSGMWPGLRWIGWKRTTRQAKGRAFIGTTSKRSTSISFRFSVCCTIDNIDLAYSLQRFYDVARRPTDAYAAKGSLITTYNSAFSRVFEEGIRHGYDSEISDTKTRERRGRDAARRPDFTIGRVSNDVSPLRTWIHEGRAGKSRQMRELLRDYVLIIANTGIRHWNGNTQSEVEEHLSTFVTIMVSHIFKFNVPVGRDEGHASLVARPSCVRYFKRIQQRCR